ncbi:cytidine deaminase [Nesterenkonia halotolerans]|uniref:Cytidine deaminase n=1 Tax=Nesterenkonia halotolerans TaxID=225325 RepID=A0ABR9J9S1_9MICC|nr:cytidine deaminase [Nesterenkonia halotolerans]MBE1515665.1 cytidine deaminase [Nesterenkonia halotolerans]
MTEDDDFLTGRIARIPAPDHDADWDRLTTQARIAMTHAYAPYSDYPVGAAALLEDGSIISGCNVENASYGLGLCAECTMIGALQMNGGGKIVAFTCVNREGEYITPCGRCRQLLHEFSAPTMHVRTAQGPTTLEALLPESFGPRDLEATAREAK